jgi:hypothetical protein
MPSATLQHRIGELENELAVRLLPDSNAPHLVEGTGTEELQRRNTELEAKVNDMRIALTTEVIE